jgi:hypothetical protein
LGSSHPTVVNFFIENVTGNVLARAFRTNSARLIAHRAMKPCLYEFADLRLQSQAFTDLDA